MATIKVACPKCGQKVSGDESFAGASVNCPVCSAHIQFPGQIRGGGPTGILKTEDYPPEERPVPGEPVPAAEWPTHDGAPAFEEVPPQAKQPPTELLEAETSRGDENEDEEEPEEVVPSPVFGAISLVASVLGVVVCGIGGILFSPVAIIFGHLSQAKARHSPVQPAPGQTLGAIGMLIGYVWLVVTILILGVLVVFEAPLRELLQNRGS